MTTETKDWPPPRKKRSKRRHCGRYGGGHKLERHADAHGRQVTACTVCGADATEMSKYRARGT